MFNWETLIQGSFQLSTKHKSVLICEVERTLWYKPIKRRRLTRDSLILRPTYQPMRNIYIAVFTTFVVLQQAINPVQIPIAATALASSQPASTAKQNYSLNLNTNTLAIELKDARPTFDDAVLKPLREAQEAKKVQAEADAKAAKLASTRRAPLVIGGDDVWAQLRYCEAGGNYTTNTGNGYFGAYQYNLSTWGNYGGYASPDLAPPEVQDAKARATQAARGWSPWPSCARSLGLL